MIPPQMMQQAMPQHPQPGPGQPPPGQQPQGQPVMPSGSGQAPDPMAALRQQAAQISTQVQQSIQRLEQVVTIDKVVRFLRDQKMRAFSIEIETDSTIMPDESAEKQARGEFLGAFAQASSGVQQLLQLGPSGAELAGGLMKFALAPYRVGRELDGLIEQFTQQAPQIVQQQMQAHQGGQDQAMAQAMAQSQQQLAQAELGKAQAQLQRVQAESQAKAAQIQLDQQKAQSDAVHEQQRLALETQRMQLEIQQAQADLQRTLAEIDRIRASTVVEVANAQTARQTADNDTARAAMETGLAAVQAANTIMPPIQGLTTEGISP